MSPPRALLWLGAWLVAKATVVGRAEQLAVEAWRQQGYAEAEVVDRKVVADHADDTVDVTITIAPGRRATVGDIGVSGTDRMDPVFVRPFDERLMANLNIVSQPATLVRRYKRFLADVVLPSGEEITAHVANPGAMMGVSAPGSRVWLSRSADPKRKLPYAWELIEAANDWNPDLLVVGSEGQSATGRILFGSVSKRVVMEANHSVRVGRSVERKKQDAPPKIIVGIDGSPAASDKRSGGGPARQPERHFRGCDARRSPGG